jgi:signal transduction histidine kinase
LQQVLVNLITNAAEALSEVVDGPRYLTIRSENGTAQTVLVSVEDNGIGLDAEDIDHIFDSFYTTKPGGIGVGLSISRSIIEAHGGHLSASPLLPHGARLCFTLPVAKAPSLQERSPSPHSPLRANRPVPTSAKPKSPRR